MQLPAPLRLASSTPFVGRARERSALNALLPRAEGEGRRIGLVGGEAGSGKSRLVREFAQEAAADGVVVLYGACDAVVRTPYGPFVKAIDGLVRGTDTESLRAGIGATGGELGRLFPELRGRLGDLPDPIAGDADTERHRLHTAVTDLLADSARRAPVLLVLEDCHWADTPSLLLLRHLAHSAADARILVLATFRDTEADVPAELADTLADLRRREEIVRLHLGGLSIDEVASFILQAAKAQALEPPGLAAELRDLTEGNAFLVCELWRTLVETGLVALDGDTVRLTRPLGDVATPESVREVVSQRLSRLGTATRDLLELAAVTGPDFDLAVLRNAAANDTPLSEALEPAIRCGMIEETPSQGLTFRFTHELVRRALYDRLTSLRRAELHLAVAEALEAEEGDRDARALADLAHHFMAAAPIDPAGRAVEYNLLAARAAASALAYEDAAAGLRAALEIGIDDEHARATVYLELGWLQFRSGGSFDAFASIREAATIARRLGDGELLAQAAIGYENAGWRPAVRDPYALELLEEASSALSPDDSPLRVGLLAGLARALDLRGNRRRGVVVRESAIAMARRIDDRRGLATTLVRAYWSRGETELEEILEMLTEARDIGVELGDMEITAEAMEWRVATLMALGELEAARDQLVVVRDLAQQTRQPFIIHVAEHYAAALALLDGRLAEADEAAERSREWGQLLTGRDTFGVYGIQMFGIRREQGRLAELAPVIRLVALDGRADGAWRPGLAALLAELGMVDEARNELVRVRAEGLDVLRLSLWLASLTCLADAASIVEDVPTAELVYPELEPLAGTNVMIGQGVACYGAADRYLGMLAATLGATALAAGHFEAALALNRRMGATTWVAHTAYEYGRLLATTGEPDRAAAMLTEAAALGTRIGMPALLARIQAVGGTPPSSLPDGLSAREAAVLRLVAQGRSNREIGAELFISEHTAANHVRSILRKTASANRTEAASYAHRRGLVSE